jgi:hypothetical protein
MNSLDSVIASAQHEEEEAETEWENYGDDWYLS